MSVNIKVVPLRQRYNFCAKMSNQDTKIVHKISRYFHTLWCALIGRDAYAKEREGLSTAVNILQDRMAKINTLYINVVDKWNEAERLNDKMNSENAKLKDEIGSYQTLIENLRGSIRDKEQQLRQYADEVDRLQKSKK